MEYIHTSTSAKAQTSTTVTVDLESGNKVEQPTQQQPVNPNRRRNFAIGGLLLIAIGVGIAASFVTSRPTALTAATVPAQHTAFLTPAPTPTPTPAPTPAPTPELHTPSCRDDFRCPTHSTRKHGRKCYDSADDCQCKHGYEMSKHGRCEKTCKNDFVCPTHSTRKHGRKCYDSADDCQCGVGYLMSKHDRCIPVSIDTEPTPVTVGVKKAQAGETCEGFDESTGKSFPSCAGGLQCVSAGGFSVSGAGNVCKPAPRNCCRAHTAECLSCAAGQSIAEFCATQPVSQGLLGRALLSGCPKVF